jgi:hypothetical protein
VGKRANESHSDAMKLREMKIGNMSLEETKEPNKLEDQRMKLGSPKQKFYFRAETIDQNQTHRDSFE